MKTLWLFIIVFVAGTGVCPAQHPDETNLRFYITSSRGPNKYEVFYQGALVPWPSEVTFSPWKPTVGVFIAPRLALETSWLRYRDTHRGGGYGTTVSGAPSSLDTYEKVDSWAIPLTARYTITRNTKRRLQVEVLAGLSYVKKSIKNEHKEMVNGEITNCRYIEGSGSNLYGMAGIGGRFQLIRHLEIVGDYGFNRVIKNVDPDVHLQLIGNRSGLTRNRSIGIRYRFNFKVNKNKEDKRIE